MILLFEMSMLYKHIKFLMLGDSSPVNWLLSRRSVRNCERPHTTSGIEP